MQSKDRHNTSKEFEKEMTPSSKGKKVTEPMWKMKDGTEIALSTMTSSHICNCILLLQKYESSHILSLGEASSFHCNGEHAGYALDAAFDDALENGYRDEARGWINIFETEIENRRDTKTLSRQSEKEK